MNIQDNYSMLADRFRPVAQQFCSIIDSEVASDRTEFLVWIYRILPGLIGEATRLPTVEFGDDEDEDEQMCIEQSHAAHGTELEKRRQLHNALKEKLGDWDLYWQVFDPTKDSEAIQGSLADDIADVYGDLKDGLNHMANDKAFPRDAIFAWRLGFYSHWGRHAMNALYTIHSLLTDTLN